MQPSFPLRLGHPAERGGVLDPTARFADFEAMSVAALAGDLLPRRGVHAFAEIDLTERTASKELVGERGLVLVDRIGQGDLVALDRRKIVAIHRRAISVVAVFRDARRTVGPRGQHLPKAYHGPTGAAVGPHFRHARWATSLGRLRLGALDRSPIRLS